MKIVTTRNSKIGSKFIRWATGEEESHFVFVFDNSLVFHSNFQGTGLAWWNHFKTKNEIVWCMDLNLPLELEEAFYRSFVDDYYGDSYDVSGALYLGYRCLLYRYFNEPIPAQNPWGNKNNHFCSELAFKPNWNLLKAGLKEKLSSFPSDLVTPKRARVILESELKELGEVKICP